MSEHQRKTVAPAKPSATIVVLRYGGSHPELLLVKRRVGDAFGETYAFPGGVVDKDEMNACEFSLGPTQEEANAILGVASSGLAYYSAGIRELFEETGVLLARDTDGNWACSKPEYEDLRPKVDKGQMRWSDFLAQQGLRMCCDALHYFAHWETPFEFPKRWSTRFFAAELPEGQDACHDGYETTDSRWMTAAAALEQATSGLIDMPYPTIKTLENLAAFKSVRELLDWTEAERRAGVGLNRLDTLDGLNRQCLPN